MKSAWLWSKLLNFFPAFRSTGGRIVSISDDWSEAELRLPLNLWTRNYVGTIFGGSMYSAVDPIYMVMLIEKLGREFVVWDKSADIKFIRPGDRELRAKFFVPDEELSEIKELVAAEGETTREYKIELKNLDDEVCALVRKRIYIASKEFYKAKKERRRERGEGR